MKGDWETQGTTQASGVDVSPPLSLFHSLTFLLFCVHSCLHSSYYFSSSLAFFLFFFPVLTVYLFFYLFICLSACLAYKHDSDIVWVP